MVSRKHRVITDTYADSVKLMQISSDVLESYDLEDASAVMGTENNRKQLSDASLLDQDQLADIDPDDLVMAVRGPEEIVSDALDLMESQLSAGGSTGSATVEEIPPKSIERGVQQFEEANLALISVPGEYAPQEAWKALNQGLHVQLFSDNVDIETERALKQHGRQEELLVMGPDCGTAIINNVPLGFANSVSEGNIGLVSASGTGLQEVSSLIDRAGYGISQAIGTGGRDLKDEVGGVGMLQGIDALVGDSDTEVIVLISKPPGPKTRDKLLKAASECPKPTVVNFIGTSVDGVDTDHVVIGETLEDTAREAVSQAPGPDTEGETFTQKMGLNEQSMPEVLSKRSSPETSRKYVRGLYTGGTLCSEAISMLDGELETIGSNLSLGEPMDEPLVPSGHTIVDLGEDELTQGRPHPMIDPELRDEQIQQATRDSEVLVVLFDVVLGHGAHANPAEGIADAISGMEDNEWPILVASVTGTESDPQGLSNQVQTLRDAGVHVAKSNAEAVQTTKLIHSAVQNRGVYE
ncbi:acyl-CoA synthetase FdrA [Halorubrum sp. SD690R]|nr:acyl-CoA synthetase FdrA [Halorubrum sp. SD690R]